MPVVGGTTRTAGTSQDSADRRALALSAQRPALPSGPLSVRCGSRRARRCPAVRGLPPACGPRGAGMEGRRAGPFPRSSEQCPDRPPSHLSQVNASLAKPLECSVFPCTVEFFCFFLFVGLVGFLERESGNGTYTKVAATHRIPSVVTRRDLPIPTCVGRGAPAQDLPPGRVCWVIMDFCGVHLFGFVFWFF